MLTDVLQAVANGLLSGALIAVPAIGFTTIFAVLRFPDFAIAAYATIGAFAGWWVNTRLGLGVFPILVAAFVAAALIGALAEHVALKPLRPAGALTTAIGSIALNLVLENAVRFVFGSDLRGYDLPLEQDITPGWHPGGAAAGGRPGAGRVRPGLRVRIPAVQPVRPGHACGGRQP